MTGVSQPSTSVNRGSSTHPGRMEKWQHLRVQINRVSRQLDVMPSQPDLGTSLQEVEDRNVLALLDELGGRGWELVTVRDNDFWLKRQAPTERTGQAHFQ